jgi:hypothetical protein
LAFFIAPKTIKKNPPLREAKASLEVEGSLSNQNII